MPFDPIDGVFCFNAQELAEALKQMPPDALVRLGPRTSFSEYLTIGTVEKIDEHRVWLCGTKGEEERIELVKGWKGKGKGEK
jgi:hypothetical protein